MEKQQDQVKAAHLRGVMLLVITAVLWSTSGLVIKWIDWHPLAIAGVRSAIAAVVIKAVFYRSSLTWEKAQLIGAVAYACTVMLFVAATKLTTAANAIVLQYTAPVYVALLGAWVLKEKTSLSDWLTIGIVFGGMVLFFQDSMTAGGLTGNLYAMASGVSLATFSVAMRKQKAGAPFGSVLLGNILTFVCGLPFMFDAGPGVNGWAALAFLGIFQLGIPYALYAMAIKYVTALEASVITMIEPLLNPVWVFLLLGEVPGPWSLAGGLVILTALVGRYVFPVIASRTPGHSAEAILVTNSSGEGKDSTAHQGE